MKKALKILYSLMLTTVLLISMTSCSEQKSDTPTIKPTKPAATKPKTTATPKTTPDTTVPKTTEPVVENVKPVRAAPIDKTNLHKSQNGIDTIDDGVIRNITSKEMAKKMGLGINLGNTMEGFWASTNNKYSGSSIIGNNTTANYEKCWGAPVTSQEIIDGMYAAGFDTLRVPVYWGNMMSDDGSFTINDAYFNRVEEIINYGLNHKMYVVINIHHYDEYIIKNFSEQEATQIMKKIWTQIANRYKEYSDYLIFEGYNENLGTTRKSDNYSDKQIYDYVNSLNKTFVDAVRATGGNNAKRMLIVSGYWTNIDKTSDPRFIVPSDTVSDRLMVSVHYVDNASFWMNKIGGDEWLQYSKSQCEELKKAFTDKGYVIFIGEVTSIYPSKNFASDAKTTDSSECLKTMLQMMTGYGYIPVLWDTNDNFYSRTDYKIKSEKDAKVISEMYNALHSN